MCLQGKEIIQQRNWRHALCYCLHNDWKKSTMSVKHVVIKFKVLGKNLIGSVQIGQS